MFDETEANSRDAKATAKFYAVEWNDTRSSVIEGDNGNGMEHLSRMISPEGTMK